MFSIQYNLLTFLFSRCCLKAYLISRRFFLLSNKLFKDFKDQVRSGTRTPFIQHAYADFSQIQLFPHVNKFLHDSTVKNLMTSQVDFVYSWISPSRGLKCHLCLLRNPLKTEPNLTFCVLITVPALHGFEIVALVY